MKQEQFLDRIREAISVGTLYIEILGVEYDLVQVKLVSDMMVECIIDYYWTDSQTSEYVILIPYPVLKAKLQRTV